MEFFMGQIIYFAGNFAPMNWEFCDGRLLQISQYPALYSILGTTYGGDGRSTFGLPDLRETNAQGKKCNGYELGKPSAQICLVGQYPVRQ